MKNMHIGNRNQTPNLLIGLLLLTLLLIFLQPRSAGAAPTWTTFDTLGLINNSITDIAFDSDENVWVSTQSSGLYVYDGTAWSIVDTSNGLASNSVTSIKAADNGDLWFATLNAGVSKYNGTIWQTYTTNDGLASNTVYDIELDKAGNVWFGTKSGVSKFSVSTFTNYDTKDGLPHNKVTALAVDSAQHIWVGTSKGIVEFDGTTWKSLYTDIFLNPIFDIEIEVDGNGNIWYSTAAGLLTKYDGNESITYDQDSGLASSLVYSIAFDSSGNKWFGTDAGVTKFDGTTWTTYDTGDGLVNNNIYVTEIGPDNIKWFGAATGGVSRLVESFDDVLMVITASANEVSVLSLVSFDISGATVFNNVLWEFGDGNTSTEINPVHSYENAGVFTITVTGYSQSDSLSVSKPDYITVAEDPLVMQAENMTLQNYSIDPIMNNQGIRVDSLSTTGTAIDTFKGPPGLYNIKLWVAPEHDGAPIVEIFVNDNLSGSRKYIQNSAYTDPGKSSQWYPITFSSLNINTNDVIKLVGKTDGNSHARIDKIVFEQGGVVIIKEQYSRNIQPSLFHVFPQPMASTLIISIPIDMSEKLFSIKIFNNYGHPVREFSGSKLNRNVIWDGNDINGKPVQPGIYMYLISGDNIHQSGKIIKVRNHK